MKLLTKTFHSFHSDCLADLCILSQIEESIFVIDFMTFKSNIKQQIKVQPGVSDENLFNT